MSDGITEAFKKTDKKEEVKMDLKYIKGLVSMLEQAIEALEIKLEDK